ncbi:MAG: PilZ domain-containing protein [Treponema sp.]|nr:PilZ domain-containing protein [Treponema sp.]
MPILFIVVVMLVFGFYWFSRKKKEGGGNWVQFISIGKEAGFSFKEVEMLRQITVQCNIEDSCSIFSSQERLDQCIRAIVRNIRMSGESEDPGIQDFLSRLYDYRKKIMSDNHSTSAGISNSRQMTDGQVLKILVTGGGVYRSQIVKNASQFMTISRPVNQKNAPPISWQGTKISVYFWREDDAGYVFDSEVLDEVISLGVSALKIAHSDSLFRTQKRRSTRIKMHKQAFLYLIKDDKPSYKLEIDPGLRCFLEDLSDTGCAVLVAGKTESGLRVKIQFALDNIPICISGVVRSTSFKEDSNRSLLRIEADPMPMETRNHILGQMFGMSQDDDDDLPFRVLDDEAAKINSGAASANNDPFAAADTASNDVKMDDLL